MKITGGTFKGRSIKTIKSNDVRPTSSKVRESIFNMIQLDITDSVMSDLFSGSGLMGIEALSRGAKKVVFTEKNPKTYKLLKENLSNFDCEYDLFLTDAIKALDKFERQSFDLFFVDPPYKQGLYETVLEKIKENNLLKTGGKIILEHKSDDDFSEIIEKYGFEIIKQKKYGDTVVVIVE